MTKPQSKAAVVRKLLSRGKGATLIEMGKATGWQPHSCRAFLTGLRKTDTLIKEQRTDGAVAYRLTNTPPTSQEKALSASEGPVSVKANVEETRGYQGDPNECS